MTPRLLAAGCLSLLLVGCSPSVHPMASKNLPPVASSRPWASLADLETGRAVFTARCGACHDLPAIPEHTAQEWPHLVEVMSHKAQLDSAQSRKLLDWVLSERATKP